MSKSKHDKLYDEFKKHPKPMSVPPELHKNLVKSMAEVDCTIALFVARTKPTVQINTAVDSLYSEIFEQKRAFRAWLLYLAEELK